MAACADWAVLSCVCCLLPCAAIVRSAFTDNVEGRLDARVASLCRILSLPVQLTVPSIYPRMFSLHDMEAEVCQTPPGAQYRRRSCRVVLIFRS